MHQRARDPGCLIPHLDLQEIYRRPKPRIVIADSDYGSDENYASCEQKEIEESIKYRTLDKEQTKAWKSQVGREKIWHTMKS